MYAQEEKNGFGKIHGKFSFCPYANRGFCIKIEAHEKIWNGV